MTSWAIVDYFLRPKPAYFAISRELRPYTVGMTRKDVQTFPDALSAARFTIDSRLEVWGTNSTLVAKHVKLEIVTYDLDVEERPAGARKFITEEDVVLAPNCATELWAGSLPGQPIRTSYSQVPKTIIVSARMLEKDTDSVIARYCNWCVAVSSLHAPLMYWISSRLAHASPSSQARTLQVHLFPVGRRARTPRLRRC